MHPAAVLLALAALAGSCSALASDYRHEATVLGGLPQEPAGNDLFGQSVAIDGDTLVVGAFSDDIELVPGEGELGNVGSVYVFRRVGTDWVREQRLLAPDAQGAAFFGIAVALDGDTLVVGAREHDSPPPGGGTPLSDQGAVYVYRRSGNGFVFDQALTPAVALGATAQFGWSVDVDGNTMAIGAPGFEDGIVDMYVFVPELDDWFLQERIRRPLALGFGGPNAFGRAVSLQGDRVLVGAPLEDNPPFTHSDAGAAYVFNRSDGLWSVDARLAPPTPQPAAAYATSVALDGSTALVGSPFEPVSGQSSAGTAYVHVRAAPGNWGTGVRLTAPTPSLNALFGQSVDLSLPRAVVGAHWTAGGLGLQQGEVHVFDDGGAGFVAVQSLLAPTATAGAFNQFGTDVALSPPRIAVGEPGYDRLSNNDGAAHVFFEDLERVFADGFEP